MGGRLWAKAREGGGSEFGFALRRNTDDDDLEIESLDAATVASANASGGANGVAVASVADRPPEILPD